jgi:peroxiredoxin
MSEKSRRSRLDDTPELPTDAPEFAAPGTNVVAGRVFRLREYTGEGVTIVAFVPTESLRKAKFLAWLTLTDGIDALVISDFRSSAPDRTEMATELRVPVLADPDGSVAGAYGVDYDRATGGRVLLIDSTNRIRRVWTGPIEPTDVHRAAKQHLDRNPDSGVHDTNDDR